MPTKRTDDQDTINEAILHRLDLLDRKFEQFGKSSSRLRVIGEWCWNKRVPATVFLIGLTLGGLLAPLLHGILSEPTRVFRTVSPDDIVRSSPNDPAKRRILASEYLVVSEQIRNQTIRSGMEALDALRMSTAQVRSDPVWKSTVEAIDRHWGAGTDLFRLEQKIRELGELFDRSCPENH